MKRFLPLLAVCALLLPVVQPARGADVSINLFYENLSGGNWYEVADYGYVWQPEVATDPNWRPYADGYWAYTDQGWTWVSYEDFGWATYHYGRWARLADYGWVWMPGTEWAPAWVSWRTGGDYVGWAPLPPAGGGEIVYEGRPITGHVDVEFGIGPAYYNFIDLRYIGEPVLRDRIFPYERNVTFINNTVNVTNITYNNSTVYNYGPDYATLSRYSVRPVQRLKLERQTGDALQAVRSGNMTKVQGNTLLVAAPQKLQKSAGAQIAPKQVKAKIEQPRVEKGWANTDPREKAKLEQKFKSENAKNVPKPDIQPSNQNAAANPEAREAAGAGAAAASPAERAGKGKSKGQNLETAPSAAPAVAASPNAGQQGKGKNKNRAEKAEAAAGASPAAAGENQPANARAEEQKAGKNKNRAERAGNRAERTETEATAAPARAEQMGKARAEENAGERNRGNKRRETNVAPAGAENERNEVNAENPNRNAVRARENVQGGSRGEGREAQERRREQMKAAPGISNRPAVAPNANVGPARHERPQAAGPVPQQRGERANQPKAKGKKKEGEPNPSPQ